MNSVFVMGSLNMDLVIQTSTFPSCGETVQGDDFFTNPGGKGANQAVASARMGAPTWMLGAVGDDRYGETLIETLASSGVNTQALCKKNTSSGIAVIILNQGNNRIILNSGANGQLSIADVEPMLRQYAKPGDIFITQFETPIATVVSAVSIARSLGMFVIVNPAPAVHCLPQTFYPMVDVLVPNELEAASLTGLAEEQFVAERAANILKNRGVNHVIITLGDKGCLYLHGEEMKLLPAVSVPVVDTTAAGDTFVGTLAASLAQGQDMLSALNDAILCSGIAVSRKGAQSSIPTRREMETYLQALEAK